MDKVKLAIVGCGGMAHSHAERLKAIPEAEIVALCDIDKGALDFFWRSKCSADPSVRRYDSIEKLLKSPPQGLNGVIIVTPHTTHFSQAMACLDAGYNVLVEKPMVTRSSHAKKLAEKVRKTGLHFQIAFQFPFSREAAYARNAIQTHALGELQTINAWSHQNWREFTAGTWRNKPSLSGGGQMYDTGAHVFNAITWLVNRPAEEVFCWLDKKGRPVDINAIISIRWQGGILGSVTISGNTPGWGSGLIVAGDKGRIHTAAHGGMLEHYNKDGRIQYPDMRFAHYTPDQNFVECLLGRAKPMSPVRYGILLSCLMDAIYKSAKTGEPVKPSVQPIPDEPMPEIVQPMSLGTMTAIEDLLNPC